jgi:tetratricopeptide (TPR) repeat protein
MVRTKIYDSKPVTFISGQRVFLVTFAENFCSSQQSRSLDFVHLQLRSQFPTCTPPKETHMKDTDTIITVLKNDLYQRRVLCFVGAGLSCRAGIITWDKLLKRLGEQLHHGAPDVADEFEKHCNNRAMAQAGGVFKKSALYDSDKQSLFDEIFIRNKHPTALHKALITLGFEGILTTNYDHLIEDAYALVRGKSLRAYLPSDLMASDLEFRDFFLAKLHGDAFSWRTVVLGVDDYKKAQWPSSILPILKERTLLVIGFGGRDHLVNELLIRADTSHVYVLMPAQEAEQYKEYLIRYEGSVPQHITLVLVEHSRLETSLERLRTQSGAQRVIDSPWGRMPSHSVTMEYPYASSELRTFYSSTKKAVCLVGPPSSGLSSFIASEAETMSLRGGTTVCRLEGKTWLPLQAYVLHLLANLPRVVYDKYIGIRCDLVGGWDNLLEARALAHALNALSEPVLIFHEYADRLSPLALTFWREFLKIVDPRFKLILACPAPVSTSIDISRIDLGCPTESSILALCQHNADNQEIGKAIKASLPWHDLQALVLAARLSGSGAISKEDAIRFALSSDTRGLIQKALIEVEKSDDAKRHIQLLKACVVFRTPRNERALSECAQIPDDTAVRKGLAFMCNLGLLIPPHIGQVEDYAMSTTVRAIVDDLIQWDDGERAQFALRTAKYFREQSVDALEDNHNRSETDVIGAVPLVSCALFHFSEAHDFDSCAQVICKMRPYLQNMCHFSILDTWVEDTGFLTTPSALNARSHYSLSCLQARLGRVKAIPAEFQRYLSAAEKALGELKSKGESCEKEEANIRFEKGILLAMQRRYRSALKIFKQEYDTRKDFKSLQRIVQTLLSLGKLREAEDKLSELFAKLESEKQVRGERGLAHDYSLAFRHKSTLSTLRLLLYDFHPKDCTLSRKALLCDAIKFADKCRKYSEHTGPSASRHTVSDKTGLGLAELKKAQAYSADRQYAKSSEYADKGVRLFAGFPNSRWWRMSCHDLAARSLAMLNDVLAARKQLAFARAAFEDSGKDDVVRACELDRTEGVIALAAGDAPLALELLKNSLSFRTVHRRASPCIEIAHLYDLANAQLALNKARAARTTLGRAFKVKLEW